MMMSWNSSIETRRPLVSMFSWICWSLSTGRAPMRPTGAWVFCDWMALITSDTARPRPVMRSVRSQTRMA